MYECDPRIVYDDNDLPEGLCNHMLAAISPCTINAATAWAVGGDEVTFQSLTFPL